MASPCFDSLDLVAIRLWFVPDAFRTTVKTQATTPVVYASPNDPQLG